MYVKVITDRQSVHIVECDRVTIEADDGEVIISRRGEVISAWPNGIGQFFYVMNEAGDTIDKWQGTTPPDPV